MAEILPFRRRRPDRAPQPPLSEASTTAAEMIRPIFQLAHLQMTFLLKLWGLR